MDDNRRILPEGKPKRSAHGMFQDFTYEPSEYVTQIDIERQVGELVPACAIVFNLHQDRLEAKAKRVVDKDFMVTSSAAKAKHEDLFEDKVRTYCDCKIDTLLLNPVLMGTERPLPPRVLSVHRASCKRQSNLHVYCGCVCGIQEYRFPYRDDPYDSALIAERRREQYVYTGRVCTATHHETEAGLWDCCHHRTPTTKMRFSPFDIP